MSNTNKKFDVTSAQNEVASELTNLTTKSSQIRFLDQLGYTRYQVSQILNIRYQHVRNVLITPLKKK